MPRTALSTIAMELDRSSPIPLYFQVEQRIEAAILDGTLAAGARLENEISLAERLNLSRPTIRRAIQDLVDKGLLVRRRGIGTQVVHGQVSRGVELTSLFDDLAMTGKKPTTNLLLRELVPASTTIAGQLGISVDSKVLHIKRVRVADGVPVAVLENWLPEAFSDIPESELLTIGLYDLLRSRGVTIRVAKQKIGARSGTEADASLLGLTVGSALLTMERAAFDNSGHGVEFGSHFYRPDLYSFDVTLVEK
ncbi:MAG: HTH-type transcriptional repressor YvoA [Actinomycetota bacterium]